MQRFVYTVHLAGRAAPVAGTVASLWVLTTAVGDAVIALSDCGDPAGGGLPALGRAQCVSGWTFTGETVFREAGTLAFGAGDHALRFRSVGAGRLGPSADPQLRQGAALWRVDGGEGLFLGASGLIAANYLVGEAGEVTAYHCGVLFIA